MSRMGFGFGSGFGSSFSVFMVLFIIMFIVVIGVILVAVFRGIGRWSHNNAQPAVPARAKVVSRRQHFGRHGGAGNDTHHTYSTYFATFEFENGQRLELQIPDGEYGMIAEGDIGILTFQGTRFLGFVRD